MCLDTIAHPDDPSFESNRSVPLEKCDDKKHTDTCTSKDKDITYV